MPDWTKKRTIPPRWLAEQLLAAYPLKKIRKLKPEQYGHRHHDWGYAIKDAKVRKSVCTKREGSIDWMPGALAIGVQL